MLRTILIIALLLLAAICMYNMLMAFADFMAGWPFYYTP